MKQCRQQYLSVGMSQGKSTAIATTKKHVQKHTSNKTYYVKTLTFSARDKKRVSLFQDQFEHIREWLKMRYSGKSLLRTLPYIDILLQEGTPETTSLKVTTDFYSQLSLQVFYQKLQHPRLRANLKNTVQGYIHCFTLLFEVVLRGGSIDNFFYTTSNILINRSAGQTIKEEFITLSVNYTSTVGLELVYFSSPISKGDLIEIFPLLPTNIARLSSFSSQQEAQKYLREMNRIIKMKGFIWNVLCWITKMTHNVIIRLDSLKERVSFEEVERLLLEFRRDQVMKELIESYKQEIEKVQKITGISLKELFIKVLQDNCDEVSWKDIYEEFFLKNKIAQENILSYIKPVSAYSFTVFTKLESVDRSFKISEEIIKSVWMRETESVKEFYLARSIAPYSMPYFLVRTNRSFSSMMKHINILQFIDKSNFSPELLKLHLDFIEASIQEIEIQKRNYLMPYSSRIPSPPQSLQSQEEKLTYMEVADPRTMVIGLKRVKTEMQAEPVVIVHHLVEDLSELYSNLYYSHAD